MDPDGIHLRLDVGARGVVKQKWDFREVLLGRRDTVDAAIEFLVSTAVYRYRKRPVSRGTLRRSPDSRDEGLTFLFWLCCLANQPRVAVGFMTEDGSWVLAFGSAILPPSVRQTNSRVHTR